ncbi:MULTISPECIES: ThuA domain-containing protein [Actinoplanes]|uniref:ThuA domain-containing protein n=1 Tax=Actinoplanes TaxID=1865 RepID=UPI0005F2CAAF|nr:MULTISPECIES: ThuA domain-containing protein [Actinoplanes]GLY04451.1 hypothetical protein Acsp01_48300 [Actinoplanes sp. NBRC 101535]
MKALIVRGGWEGHQPVACTDLFRSSLTDHGLEVVISDSLDVYTDPAALDGVGLIVQCWTRGSLTPAQEEGLVAHVGAGAGFAGWHGGVLAMGYEAARYQYMVGGRFVCHPGGMVDHTVDVTGDDPVTAGVTSFAVHTEQYFCHVDPTLDVLATTTFTGDHGAPETAGAVMPVVWKRRFGQGRVFVNTLGHAPEDLLRPETWAMTERGLLWAAR